MTGEKQYLAVLRSVAGGAETSREVADELGISVATASAQLTYLAYNGWAVRAGEFWRHDAARSVIRWRITKDGQLAVS